MIEENSIRFAYYWAALQKILLEESKYVRTKIPVRRDDAWVAAGQRDERSIVGGVQVLGDVSRRPQMRCLHDVLLLGSFHTAAGINPAGPPVRSGSSRR